ncbi:hypothetical protein D0A38_16400 [Xanthomonas campestris pv. incanae]|nr:hypothetical protein D0A38_16400 [Xanthomonas campestris pv. incanae]
MVSIAPAPRRASLGRPVALRRSALAREGIPSNGAALQSRCNRAATAIVLVGSSSIGGPVADAANGR